MIIMVLHGKLRQIGLGEFTEQKIIHLGRTEHITPMEI